MKKIIKYIAPPLAAVIMSSAALFSVNEPSSTPLQVSPAFESKNTGEKEASGLYTVREYMGKIAVYSSDGQLLKLTSGEVASLPKADREALAKGIELDSSEQLAMLLEDLLS